ncbi:MAG: ATP-binding cassette domain-containing protein [Treponema sp.]|jgi:multiple sugar transport system ATP-binding protein|nr:ATP-binding cassette domain-containing protein [Treponema sp.]
MSYLELRDLQKRYSKDGPLIVNRMNLSIEKGEFIVFLGPSGCGKTTTIRMISGLEEVSGGDILIDGESVLRKKPKDRGVSMIFQSYAIWPHMTVFDNIAYPLKLQKLKREEIRARVEAAAGATGIEGFLDRYPRQMSGGQRQRVAVSRAIVVRPKIFLMDEPLSNLDAKLRVSMRTELKRIHRQENSTTIFVTHDQAEAMSLADRIIVMYQGKIEQIGTPREVYRNSATRFVASFIGTPPTNFFTVKIEKAGDGFIAVHPGFKYQVPPAMNGALAPYAGKEAVLGIRPEFIGLSPAMDRGESWICDTTVDFVEPQGSYSIMVAHIGGEELKIVSSEFLDLPVNTRSALSVRDAMFFDPDTGNRIGR